MNSSRPHPLSEQCTAKSKRSGQRCQHLVIGGGVCWIHGGRAPQVAARREQRVLLAEAEAAAPAVVETREPEEILLDALHDTNAVLRQIKHELGAGSLSSTLLAVAGEWFDRVARIAKVVVDGDIAARLERRRERVTAEQVDALSAVLRNVFADPRVSCEAGQMNRVVVEAMAAAGIGDHSPSER